MAVLTAAQIVERRKELKPARLLAFKLCQENPQITSAELGQAHKEKGFEVARNTIAAWLTRFKKHPAIRTHEAKPHPGSKPTPARLFAFKLWEENSLITGAELDQALKEKGFQVHKSTCYLWLKSFRAEEPSEITLEQIIKATGSIEALSLLFYQGVMEVLKRRDSAYDVLKQDCLEKDELISRLKHELSDVTRERNKIIREFNERIASVKIGTLTLDQIEHRLIPKK